MRRSSRRAKNLCDDPRLRPERQFGGTLLKGNHAKGARPVSTRKGMHIVLQSESAVGSLSMSELKKRRHIERIIRSQAKKHKISVRKIENFGRTLHLLIKLRHKKSFTPFIRSISGMIALFVTGARKCRGLKKRFWDFRPWSRIVNLLPDYSLQRDELLKQVLISLGMIAVFGRGEPRVLESS